MKKYVLGLLCVGLLVSVAIPVLAAGIPSTLTGFGWDPNIAWFSWDAAGSPISVGTNGNLSGYAWNPGVGWFYFNPNLTGPDGGKGAKMATTVNGDYKYPLSGWFRACAAYKNGCPLPGIANPNNSALLKDVNGPELAGWDGWVKMTDNFTGTQRDFNATYNPTTNKYEGFAWGGLVTGWLNLGVSNLSSAFSVTCSANDGDIEVNEEAIWTAYVTGGTASSYQWYENMTGAEPFGILTGETEVVSSRSYDTEGTYYRKIRVTGTAGEVAEAVCSAPVDKVIVGGGPSLSCSKVTIGTGTNLGKISWRATASRWNPVFWSWSTDEINYIRGLPIFNSDYSSGGTKTVYVKAEDGSRERISNCSTQVCGIAVYTQGLGTVSGYTSSGQSKPVDCNTVKELIADDGATPVWNLGTCASPTGPLSAPDNSFSVPEISAGTNQNICANFGATGYSLDTGAGAVTIRNNSSISTKLVGVTINGSSISSFPGVRFVPTADNWGTVFANCGPELNVVGNDLQFVLTTPLASGCTRRYRTYNFEIRADIGGTLSNPDTFKITDQNSGTH